MGKSKSDNLKQDIIDAAMTLFREEGYEKTSVNAVCNKVGVSKGGFYHYFQSKEDILVAIAQQYTDAIIKIPLKILQDTSLNGLEKMNQLINQLLQFKTQSREKRFTIIETMEMEGNLKLKQKITDSAIRHFKNTYQFIIEQGIEEGIFHNAYPDEAAELWVTLIMNMNIGIVKLLATDMDNVSTVDKIKRRVFFYQDTMERILEIPKGSLKLSDYIIDKLNELYRKK